MKQIVFFLSVLITAVAVSCNQGNNANNNSGQFGGPGGGMGQGNFNPEEMAKRQSEELKGVLGLNSDQEKQIYDLTIESSKQMQKLRESMQANGGGFEGMREQMQQMREEQNNKIREILTNEQWEKYQTWQEERRSQKGQGRSGGFGGQRPS